MFCKLHCSKVNFQKDTDTMLGGFLWSNWDNLRIKKNNDYKIMNK